MVLYSHLQSLIKILNKFFPGCSEICKYPAGRKKSQKTSTALKSFNIKTIK